jgi:DNA-binding NtrC family response regulator
MDKTARILIVDDDKSIRKSLGAILARKGYVVDLAACGSEAIQKTESATYNVAVIDIRQPDMEGTELLRRMRDTFPKMRKIVLTGFPSQKNAIDSLNNKADAYLLKPIEIEEFLKTIQEQLELQENEKSYSEQKVAEFIETRMRQLSGPA